jgi:hypothetical protein
MCPQGPWIWKTLVCTRGKGAGVIGTFAIP